MRSRALRLLAVIVVLTATEATGQDLPLESSGEDPAAVILKGILDRGQYQTLDRDTVLAASESFPGDLIVLDARVALEGTVEGSVAVVGGDFFIRPRAVVRGPIAVIGGGAYPSGLAEVGQIVYVDPRVSIERAPLGEPAAITLTRPPGPGLLRLPNIYGFGPASYDRVNGLSLFWAGEVASAGDTAAVSLFGTAGYRFERNRLDGSISLRVRPRPRTRIVAHAGRFVRTGDAWIRGDLANSFSSLFVRSDVRDYFESDEVALSLERTPPPPLIAGEGFIAPRISLRLSRDRSLSTGNPFSLTARDDAWRANPPIDEGVLGSVSAAFDAGWRGSSTRFVGSAGIEWAPGAIGDYQYAQLRAAGSWSMVSLYQHRIQVFSFLQVPLTRDEAPRQRWTLVGGPGTLPTLPIAAMRGDHAVFVQSVYLVPMPRFQLPLVGIPAVRFTHALGSAWRTGNDRAPFEQNAGIGLQLSIFDLMMNMDPTESGPNPTFSIGARLPVGSGPTF